MKRIQYTWPGLLTLLVSLAAGPASAQAPAATAGEEARETNLSAYTELLRTDIRAQKTAIIAGMMQFTEAEDAAFWPVYREYEAELEQINDDRIALVEDYASHYDTLTDADAARIARGALDVEARRTALKAKYFDRFASVIPAKSAARFLQVENQILLLLDLQIASSLPIAR